VTNPKFKMGRKSKAEALIRFNNPIPSGPINFGNRYILLKAPTANPR
jgi:hypothetical protein